MREKGRREERAERRRGVDTQWSVALLTAPPDPPGKGLVTPPDPLPFYRFQTLFGNVDRYPTQFGLSNRRVHA